MDDPSPTPTDAGGIGPRLALGLGSHSRCLCSSSRIGREPTGWLGTLGRQVNLSWTYVTLGKPLTLPEPQVLSLEKQGLAGWAARRR